MKKLFSIIIYIGVGGWIMFLVTNILFTGNITNIFHRNNNFSGNIINSGNNILGQYGKTITTGFEINKSIRTIFDYPKIRVNNPVKDITILAEVTFTDEFIKKYNYKDSTGYFFALKFFLGDFDNGGYYNVYRKQDGSVGNSEKHDLVGAKLAYEIRDGVTWYIPLNNKTPVAVNTEEWLPTYQYKYLDMEKYLNDNIGKEIPIGVYLSSVSGVKGWELTQIKELKIIYTGKKGDLEIIN